MPVERGLAELFKATCDMDAAERQKYLARETAGNAALRAEVETLLQLDADSDNFLELVTEHAADWIAESQTELASIGPYRIIRMIGEGGMGAVYEAEQTHPNRRVALKVIKPGLLNPDLVWRFELEWQALGRLQHQGIAHIYEARTGDGEEGTQPFFAMEFIRGLKLCEFAEQGKLDTNARLQIFIKICEAVQHAHLHGILHCDLKPANILVDETGQPKVLDFGVARAIGSGGEVPEIAGTLAYMSPEQRAGEPGLVDVRSDVYSLGIVLLELLSGNKLGGDLECIVKKARETDAAQRYASAMDLAADIQRFQRNEPILARTPTAAYVAGKLMARHKVLVAALSIVMLILIAASAVSRWQAWRAIQAEQIAMAERNRAITAEMAAQRERDHALKAEHEAELERNNAGRQRDLAIAQTKRADTSASIAKAVSEFVSNDLLAQAASGSQGGPEVKPDPDLRVRVALDRAAARISGKFAGQPQVEAAIRSTIGKAYTDLALFHEAQQQLERATEIDRANLGPDHRDTLAAEQALAQVLNSEAKPAEAEAILRRILPAVRRLDSREALQIQTEMARSLNQRGDYAQSEALMRQVLSQMRKMPGLSDAEFLPMINDLATYLSNQGKYVEAEQLYRQVLVMKQRALGNDHPSTLLTANSLAVMYRMQGKYKDAEPLLISVLAARRKVRGNLHIDTAASLNSLGLLYQAEGKFDEADKMMTESLAASRQLFATQPALISISLYNLGELRRRQGRIAEAEAAFSEVVAMRTKALGPDHPNTARAMVSLGELKLSKGSYAEAEALFRKALEMQIRKTPDSWRRYRTETLLGAALTSLGQSNEAQRLMESGYNGLAARLQAIPVEDRWVIDDAQSRLNEKVLAVQPVVR